MDFNKKFAVVILFSLSASILSLFVLWFMWKEAHYQPGTYVKTASVQTTVNLRILPATNPITHPVQEKQASTIKKSTFSFSRSIFRIFQPFRPQ